MKIIFSLVILLLTNYVESVGNSNNFSKIQSFLTNQKPEKNTPKEIEIDKKYLTGHFVYLNDTNFIQISPFHGYPSIYLRKETYNAFIRMYEAAKIDKIKLMIVSGTRNFPHQKNIWERKWYALNNSQQMYNANKFKEKYNKAKDILKYNSMPSTSRHHWGTEVDLNSDMLSYFYTAEGIKVYDWLCKNANKFGFYQVYKVKSDKRPNGYEEEKWHWSYKPLSDIFFKQYLKKVTINDVKGFLGWEVADTIGVIDNYVKMID